eukprot:3460441-Amphidinium_carterae.1
MQWELGVEEGGSVSDTRAQQEDGAKVALQEAFHLCDEDRDGFLSEQDPRRDGHVSANGIATRGKDHCLQ